MNVFAKRGSTIFVNVSGNMNTAYDGVGVSAI